MTAPTVSNAAQEMYDAISQWHPTDAQYGWPGLYWCEALCGAGGLETVESLSRDSSAGPGWSALLDLNRCPDTDLPYLAQFRGIVLPSGLAGDVARSMITTQPAAARGRPATIIAAVQQTLTGTKRVTLLERDTSPYHATVRVFGVQMPDEAATRAAIASVKPGMLVVDLEVLSGPTYGETKTPLPANPDYGDREGYFPTYGDIQEYVP